MFLVLALATASFAYDGPLHAGQHVTIGNVLGSVTVRTGERFALRATKRAKRSDPNAVAIHVDPRPDGLVVCVRYPPDAGRGCDEAENGTHDNDTVVDFTVTVPSGIDVSASSVNGKVDVVNDGPTDATSVNGDVRVEGREVRRVETVNGSIAARVLDRSRGELRAKTVNGSITLSLAPGSGVTIDAHTLNGAIDAAGIGVEHPRYGPGATAHGTIGDGALRVDASSINGSITVRR